MKWMVHGTCACCWYANGRIISQHVYFCLFDKKNSNKEIESDNTCKKKSTQESQNPVITIYWYWQWMILVHLLPCMRFDDSSKGINFMWFFRVIIWSRVNNASWFWHRQLLKFIFFLCGEEQIFNYNEDKYSLYQLVVCFTSAFIRYNFLFKSLTFKCWIT